MTCAAQTSHICPILVTNFGKVWCCGNINEINISQGFVPYFPYFPYFIRDIEKKGKRKSLAIWPNKYGKSGPGGPKGLTGAKYGPSLGSLGRVPPVPQCHVRQRGRRPGATAAASRRSIGASRSTSL